MSDELLNEDLDVEGHVRRRGANDEPSTEDEVEGHVRRRGANDDPAEDDENDFEAHVRYPNVRMD